MDMLRYVVVANGLLAVVSFAFWALLRRETFFGANRLALWLGLTASLGLPLLELPDWRPQPVRVAMHRTAQVIVPRVLGQTASPPDVTITYPNGQTYPAFDAKPANGFRWSWPMGLIGVYLTGVLLLLIRFGVQIASLKRLINASAQETYDDFTLVQNSRVQSPFSFFDWVVLNPAAHEPDELEQILRHERIHVRQGHSFDMLGAELVCILFWFNPTAYLFRHLLRQTLEFAADRAVLAEGVDARAYQYNLVKVSLSAGPSALTNHFSKSQLKSRIVMLNKPESARITWLKYPVLGIAALTVATAFARPSTQTLRKFVPVPVAETVASVLDPIENSTEPALVAETPVRTDTVGQAFTQPEKPSVPLVFPADSVRQIRQPDSVRTSPSRYIVYKGDYLYWVVTPKTTFDDFAVMKQEFAKQGCQLQLNEVKYDPLYTYIERIDVTVVRATGGMTQVNDFSETDKPISPVAGFVGIGPKKSRSGTGELKALAKDFPIPDVLHTVAEEDQRFVAEFANEHRLDYLLRAGAQKFKDFGSGATTYSKDFFENKSTRSSGITVNPDGSLAVNNELDSIPVFINNEPVTHQAVRQLTLERLHAVVKKTLYNPAREQSTISALLIYATED